MSIQSKGELMKRIFISVLIAFLSLMTSNTAFADIINIDSITNTINKPIVINFDAGTYSVLPIGISTGGTYNAVNPWGDEPNGWYHVYSISSLSINNNQFPTLSGGLVST